MLRYILSTGLGILFGAGSALTWHLYVNTNEQLIVQNWRIVDEFTAKMRGDSRSTIPTRDGFLLVDDVVDPDPALAFLVSNGELCFVDLVFPTVTTTRETNRIWLNFASDNYPDIITATGHTNDGLFRTSGGDPLHLNIWYKPTDKARNLVREMISLIESSERVSSK